MSGEQGVRRERKDEKKYFCGALAVLLFALCALTEAQQPVKVYKIGFLSGGFPGPTHWSARLRAALEKLGYVEGKNITIEARFTENKIDRLPTLAAELVRLKPDVLARADKVIK